MELSVQVGLLSIGLFDGLAAESEEERQRQIGSLTNACMLFFDEDESGMLSAREFFAVFHGAHCTGPCTLDAMAPPLTPCVCGEVHPYLTLGRSLAELLALLEAQVSEAGWGASCEPSPGLLSLVSDRGAWTERGPASLSLS